MELTELIRDLKPELMPIKNIKPYRMNAKKHPPEQVEQIARSIAEYGFNDPVAIWGPENVIIEGHGRYLAAKKMKLSAVPVIRLDHLTDEQRREYAILHNQLTMNTGWDLDALSLELDALPGLDADFYKLGLETATDAGDNPGADELGDDPDGEWSERNLEPDAGERTVNRMNLTAFDPERATGFYQIPILEPCDHVPAGLMKFDNIMAEKSRERYDMGIHFFMHDCRFERFWERPDFFIEKLKAYDCVLTPDYSLYMDMPMAMKIWNVYRARLLGQMMQDAGIKVIPTLVWAEPETYAFCFDGLGPGGTVATSTVGVMRDPEAEAVWRDGMAVALDRIKPNTVVVYGYKQIPEFDPRGAQVVHLIADRFDV